MSRSVIRGRGKMARAQQPLRKRDGGLMRLLRLVAAAVAVSALGFLRAGSGGGSAPRSIDDRRPPVKYRSDAPADG